jgi:hypothetical protein
MRLKDYARNPEKRKVYVQQPGLLLIGVDIIKTKHDACIGIKTKSFNESSHSHILVKADVLQ